MTIQELYDYAKKNQILDYDLEVYYTDDFGFYIGSRKIYIDEICIEEKIKTVFI